MKAGIKARFWGEALNHTAYLYNRTATLILGLQTPHEPLLKSVLKNSLVRIFRRAVFAHGHQVKRKFKLDDRLENGA